jgi:hypothetical protein
MGHFPRLQLIKLITETSARRVINMALHAILNVDDLSPSLQNSSPFLTLWNLTVS